MKKIMLVSLILAVAILLCTLCPVLSIAATSENATFDDLERVDLMGDVDGDHNVSIMDVTDIQRIIARLLTPSDDMLVRAKVLGTDELSVMDATAIQRFIAKLSYDGNINVPVERPIHKPTEQPDESPVVDHTQTEVFSVVFKDYDGSVLSQQAVRSGEAAVAPDEPLRRGYVFIGWDKSYAEVTADTIITAMYKDNGLPAVEVDTVSAVAGANKVKVAVSIRNNPGIVGMTLKLNYNEEVLTLTKVTKGEALSEMTFTAPKNLANGCNLPWDAEAVESKDATNGEILVMEFDVKDSAKDGLYNISLSYEDGAVIDNDLNPVEIVVINGAVEVQ